MIYGDERPGRAERVATMIVAVASVGVIAWLALMVTDRSMAQAPGSAAAVQESVADSRSAGRFEEDWDAALITRGGNMSWQVIDACGRDTTECGRVMRDVNREASRYGLRVLPDGSITPR